MYQQYYAGPNHSQPTRPWDKFRKYREKYYQQNPGRGFGHYGDYQGPPLAGDMLGRIQGGTYNVGNQRQWQEGGEWWRHQPQQGYKIAGRDAMAMPIGGGRGSEYITY